MKAVELSLAQTEPQPLVARDPESILRYAMDKGASVEVIERMMAVRRELRGEQAKEAFDRAMKAFQRDCPVIQKEIPVPDRSGKTAYKFAPIEAVKIQIKPFEDKYGFHHTFPKTEVKQGWITAFCEITHDAGHSIKSEVTYPIGTKTGIMSDTQVYAATETFCMRRALANGYGVTIAGEDIDGATGKAKPKGPSSLRGDGAAKVIAKQLWDLLKPVRGTEQNWKAANQWMWDENIITDAEAAPELSAEQFAAAITKAKLKLNK